MVKGSGKGLVMLLLYQSMFERGNWVSHETYIKSLLKVAFLMIQSPFARLHLFLEFFF